MLKKWKVKLEKAWKLFVNDMKNMWLVLVVLTAYFVIQRNFFHSSCPMVIFTGYPCPGCGLTRAGMALLHGEFIQAFNMHPFIYVIAVWCLFFLWDRYFTEKKSKWIIRSLMIIIIGMLVFYAYRMLTDFPGTPPMSYYENNLLQKIVNLKNWW